MRKHCVTAWALIFLMILLAGTFPALEVRAENPEIQENFEKYNENGGTWYCCRMDSKYKDSDWDPEDPEADRAYYELRVNMVKSGELLHPELAQVQVRDYSKENNLVYFKEFGEIEGRSFESHENIDDPDPSLNGGTELSFKFPIPLEGENGEPIDLKSENVKVFFCYLCGVREEALAENVCGFWSENTPTLHYRKGGEDKSERHGGWRRSFNASYPDIYKADSPRISAELRWLAEEHPERLEAELLCDGAPALDVHGERVPTLLFTEDGGWKTEVQAELPRYAMNAEGQVLPCEYTLSVQSAEGFREELLLHRDETDALHFVIAEQKERACPLTLRFEDAENRDGTRPGQVRLYFTPEEGEPVSLELSAQDGECTVMLLPCSLSLDAFGELQQTAHCYLLNADEIPGYVLEAKGDPVQGFSFVFRHDPESSETPVPAPDSDEGLPVWPEEPLIVRPEPVKPPVQEEVPELPETPVLPRTAAANGR